MPLRLIRAFVRHSRQDSRVKVIRLAVHRQINRHAKFRPANSSELPPDRGHQFPCAGVSVTDPVSRVS
jgi:hypothetical protein